VQVGDGGHGRRAERDDDVALLQARAGRRAVGVDAVDGDAARGGEAAGLNQQYLMKAIRTGTDRTPGERKDLRAANLANIEQVSKDVLAGSDALRPAAAAGRLQVVGAYYELASGRVIFSEPVAASTSTPHR
jgi:hypothetical protein